MRICVISNSHAASLKDGWNALRDSIPHVELTFFAAANRLMAELEADYVENILQVNNPSIKNMLSFTSGGLDVIDVMNYDAFLVYGLFLSVPRLDRRHSSAVKRLTTRDSVKDSINYQLVNDLCHMTNAPVYYTASPLLSDSILDNEADSSVSYHDYHEVCDWMDEHYNYPNTLQVKQIEQTMGRDLTTLKEYSKGSVRLTKIHAQHIQQDVMHMNAQYGEQFMKMFLLDEIAKLNTSIANAA